MTRAAWLLFACAGCHIADVHFTSGDGGEGVPDRPDLPAGSYVWARSLSTLLPLQMVSGPGGIVVTGYTYSTVDLGGQLLTSVGGSDMIIAGFTETDATHLFSMRYGDVGDEFAWVNNLDSTGAPYVVGVSYGTCDLGKGQVAGGGGAGADGYIGRYAGGSAQWIQRIVGPGEDKIVASGLGPNATIYGAGWFEGTTMFNASSLTSAGGRDLFLARFGTFSSTVDLVKQWGGTGRDELSGMATRGSEIIVAGFYDDTINFGGTAAPITATGGNGLVDFFVAKLASDGSGIWAVTFGGPGEDRDPKIVLDSAGDIYVTGTFTTMIQMGTYTLNAVGGSGADQFVAKLRGSDGSVVWAVSFGSTGNEIGGRIAVDNSGHVTFDGSVQGALDGGPTLGGVDAVIAEYDSSNGAMLWRHVYSTAGDDRGGGVAYATSGDLLAGIQLAGTYDFGVPLIGAPNAVGVLLRIAP